MDGSRVDRRSASTCSLETWKPQLTVPRGPQLQVVRRLSAPRWPGSTGWDGDINGDDAVL